jgi:hypothetical protein
VQFYSGFGSLEDPSSYEAVIKNGYPPNVVVAGMITNPTDGGGFVDISTVNSTVHSLVKKYPNFGGVDGFEYYNAEPGGKADPAQWATVLGKAMKK